jgi:hypothetical protein
MDWGKMPQLRFSGGLLEAVAGFRGGMARMDADEEEKEGTRMDGMDRMNGAKKVFQIHRFCLPILQIRVGRGLTSDRFNRREGRQRERGCRRDHGGHRRRRERRRGPWR